MEGRLRKVEGVGLLDVDEFWGGVDDDAPIYRCNNFYFCSKQNNHIFVFNQYPIFIFNSYLNESVKNHR